MRVSVVAAAVAVVAASAVGTTVAPSVAAASVPARGVAVPGSAARAVLPEAAARARAVSPATLPTVRRTMRRCSSWTFVPPATTTCRIGTLVPVSVRLSGGTVFAWSTSRRAWVAIAYSWSAARKRLEVDQSKLRMPAPAPGTTSTVWRYACTSWRLDAARTVCTAGRPQRVTARFGAPGTPVVLLDAAHGTFAPSAYRWASLGGYLVLDALLLPAASVDLGATMAPRPSPAITDYVVSCPGGTVTAAVTARGGASVVLDGAAARTTSGTVPVALAAGQAVRWTLVVPGRPPVQQQARCLPADFGTWRATRTGTPASQWYVTAPWLGSADPGYLVVADAWGTPVWWSPTPTGRPLDVRPTPGGLQYVDTSGGPYSVASSFYRMAWDGGSLGSGGTGLGLDHHEMLPAGNGSTFALRYVERDCLGAPADCADMSAFGGTATATIVDAEVVAFDASGTVVWSWRARDHIALAEFTDLVPADRGVGAMSMRGVHDYWDVMHANSIEQDGDGIIVSFRNLDAVYRIRKADGSIDWKLGGTPTARSLAVLGADRYPLTNNQHDARRLPDGRISLFDNGSETLRAPRVLELTVDPAARTATVERVVLDARVPLSSCCGSARRVSSGGFVVAWGGPWAGNPSLVTETNAAGAPVLSIDTGSVWTYRAVPVEPGQIARADLVAGMDSLHPRTVGARAR